MKLKNIFKNITCVEKTIYHMRGLLTTQELIDRGMRVGKDFFRGHEVLLDNSCCWLLEIGDSVILSDHVKIYCHDASTKKFLGFSKMAPVKIGNRVYVGAGTIILPGVTIGNDVIIGAGSVVTHDIPDETLAYGVPARVISPISEYLSKEKERSARVPFYSKEEKKKILSSIDEKEKVREQVIQSKFGYID